MATDKNKKKTLVKVRDLKPAKDAKGGISLEKTSNQQNSSSPAPHIKGGSFGG